MSRPAGTVLQLFLGALVVVALAVQVLVLPAHTADITQRFPEVAYPEVPVLVLSVAAVAGMQVAVVCVMALLGLVGQDRIFDPAAYRYVDVFIGAALLASLLVLGAGVLESVTVGRPAWVSAGGVALAGVGVALLMVVMRALLHQATAQHAELAEVV